MTDDDLTDDGVTDSDPFTDLTDDLTDDLFDNPAALKTMTAHDRDGRRIGAVEEVYVDDGTRRPEWVTVRAGGPHGEEETFLPLHGAVHDPGGNLRVAFSLGTVEKAPRINADQHLGLDQEQELYVHYGLTAPEGEASGAPGVGDDRPRAPLTGHDRGMELVHELTDERPADRARLRKYVPPENPGAARTPGAGENPDSPGAVETPPSPESGDG
jgi:hypothetical protein